MKSMPSEKFSPELITDIYIRVMLLVFPLWTGFQGYTAITEAKYLFFVVSTLLWILSLVLSLILRRPSLTGPSAGGWAIFAFMLWSCVSALCSAFFPQTLIGASRYDGLCTLLLYGCIYLGVSRFGRPRLVYLRLMAVSMALCCAVAALQLLRINILGLFPDGLTFYDSGYKYTGAFLGTIGNTDVLSAWLCLSAPAFIAAALLIKGRCLWLLIPAALTVFISAASGVSGGVLAMLAVLIICAPFLTGRLTGRKNPSAIAACISVAAILTGLAVCYFWPGTSGTVWESSRILHGELDDAFGAHRIGIWRETLRLIGERPILGGGPDTMGLRTELGYSRYVEETGLLISVHIDNAHNEYLNYFVNIGLPGLLAYLAVITFTLRDWLKSRAPVKAALGCGLICYLVSAFFGLGLCFVVPAAFIFMGLISSREEEV